LREREEKYTWYTKIPRSEATAKKQMNHRTTSPAMIEASNFQPVKLRIQPQLSLSLSRFSTSRTYGKLVENLSTVGISHRGCHK
jgi:hypothetical protein